MRKSPRQARSREMVERIVTAGRKVLMAEGYDAFSTNRVAAVARVSPGSVYQYFDDKTAIVDEVVERYWEEVTEMVVASLADRIGEFGPNLVRDIADALVSALEPDPELLRVTVEVLPLQRSKPQRTATERRVRELATAYFAARPESSRRQSPAAASWVVVLAIENLAIRWILDHPVELSRDELLDEITALIDGYLGTDPPLTTSETGLIEDPGTGGAVGPDP